MNEGALQSAIARGPAQAGVDALAYLQQIASIGKIIQVQTNYLQFPLAAANAVILLAIVLMIIWALTRMVDIRKEL